MSDALEEGLDEAQERYRQLCRPLFRNIFLKNLKSPFMYNPMLRDLVMRSGIRALDGRCKEA